MRKLGYYVLGWLSLAELEYGGTKLRRNYRCDTSAHAHNGTAARTAPASTALRSEADTLKGGVSLVKKAILSQLHNSSRRLYVYIFGD